MLKMVRVVSVSVWIRVDQSSVVRITRMNEWMMVMIMMMMMMPDDDDVDDDDDDDDESSWWKGRGARKWRFYQPKRPKYPFMAPRLCLKLVFIVWDSIYFLKHRIEYGVQDKSNMMVRHISYHIIYHIYQSKAEDVKGWQILTCLERSSAELMGATMRSTVRKAARLAVYEEIKIKEKNHHTPPWQVQGCFLFSIIIRMRI